MARAHVAPRLLVGNLEKSLAFYAGLGFRAVARVAGSPPEATVDLLGARLTLAQRGPPPRGPPGEGVVLRVTVVDFGVVLGAAQRLGAAVDGTEPGVFRVVDPDGYVLEFARERKRAKPKPRRAVKRKRRRRGR